MGGELRFNLNATFICLPLLILTSAEIYQLHVTHTFNFSLLHLVPEEGSYNIYSGFAFFKKKKCSTLQLHAIFHFECRVCSNIVKLLLHILTLSIQLTVMVGSLVQCGLLFFMDMGILHAYTSKFLCPICLCTFLSGALLSNI